MMAGPVCPPGRPSIAGSPITIGVHAILTSDVVSAVEFGHAVEEREIESLWVSEHSHIPVDTVHPHSRDGSVPEFYKRLLDPFVVLSAIAATTKRVRIGTSVVLVAEHNVFHLAKQVASLDHLSGGRVELGVGYGWNTLEAINNGVAPADRRLILLEKLRAARHLWSEEVAAFEGDRVRFTPSWAWPKPVQQPAPPILLGAPGSRRTFDDVLAVADGWMPLRAYCGADLGAQINGLRELADESGCRVPTVVVFDPETGTRSEASREEWIRRMPSLQDVEKLGEAGVSRVILGVPVRNGDLMRAALDDIVELKHGLQSTG